MNDLSDGLRAEAESLRLELSGVCDLLEVQARQHLHLRAHLDDLVADLRSRNHHDPADQLHRLLHPEERP